MMIMRVKRPLMYFVDILPFVENEHAAQKSLSKGMLIRIKK